VAAFTPVTAKKPKGKFAKSNGSAPTKEETKAFNVEKLNGTGRIMRRWRESKPNPMTREELAKRMGCCMSTIRNWEEEKGSREPRTSQLLRLEDIKPGLLAKLFRSVWRALLANAA
jgi:DNA-binding transcriptional regulator YiaG